MLQAAEDALWELAEALRDAMERLDPCDEREWAELNSSERSLFYFAIKETLLKHDAVLRAIEIDSAYDSEI